MAKLPNGKSIVDLFTDFIRYLSGSAVAHIKEAGPTRGLLWENYGTLTEKVEQVMITAWVNPSLLSAGGGGADD